MAISDTIRKALIDAVTELPSLANLRLPYLQAWFSDSGIKKFVCFYKLMGDNDSKLLLLKLLYNSIGQLLGGEIERFHNFSSRDWHKFEVLARDIKPIASTYELDLIETWILSGYAYKDKCQVDTGDIVLDCGAYTGNTAFYFADKAGPDGRIFSFEAMPQSFALLQKNIASSGYRNIIAHQYAIADVCENACFTRSAFPGSCRVSEGNGIYVPQISIDQWVKDNDISRVDFIKMDIEGSELSALKGATDTIRRFHPKLAICIYHRASDFITIPQAILAINPCYRFFLKHNSKNFLETVLFAEPVPVASKAVVLEQEINEIKSIWKIVQAIHGSRSKFFRSSLLKQYANSIEQSYRFLGRPRYDETKYSFVYWPLSDDGRLHYEILFVGNSCEISLHFEGKYSKLSDIIDEICKESKLHLRNNTGPYKGVAIIRNDLENINNIVQYMGYLIELTLPILQKYKLLSDVYVLDQKVQKLCQGGKISVCS